MSKPLLAALIIILSIKCGYTSEKSNQISLFPEQQTSSEGFFSLSWNTYISNDNSNQMTLEIAAAQDFSKQTHRIDVSLQDKIHLTGFGEGVFYARLIDPDGNVVSSVARVDVKHHPLSRATALFFLGAVIFIGLVSYILRQNSKKEH